MLCRIDHIYQDPHIKNRKFILKEFPWNIVQNHLDVYEELLNKNLDEIYNLAAQSHVQVLFNLTEYTVYFMLRCT